MRALAFLAALFLLAAPALAAPAFPKLTGRVVDGANLLSPANEAALTQKLAALESQTGRQLVVVTLPSLQGYEIEEFGYQLGRAWGIGRAGKNDGVLFIVAPNEHQVRIEVGYGLEPILTDALSSVILQQAVLPAFRKGDMEAGVMAGADAILEQLSLDEGAAKARVAQAQQAQQKRDHGGPGFFFVLVGLFIALSVFGRLFGGRGGWWLPFILLNGMASGGRGGRWGGGGGFGGGGFSGGGGSFGGGGASGRW